MTRLILSYRRAHDDALPSFRVIDQFPAVIGRGLECDVIVGDPYVAPKQAAIRSSENGWEICDLADINPTLVNAKPLAPGAWRPLHSGDVIVIGRSEMTAYAPQHTVAPTMPLPREGTLTAVFARGWVSLAMFAAALALAAGFAYLEIWSNEAPMTSALVTASAAVVMVLWAGMWSVVGRLAVHRSRFVMQLGWVAAYISVSLIVSVLLRGLDFLLSGNWLSHGVALTTQLLLLAALAYGSLGIATALGRRKRMQGALSFAGGLMLSIVSLQAIGSMGFSPVPPFSSSLSPALARFASASSAESFMTAGDALFDDPALSAQDSGNVLDVLPVALPQTENPADSVEK